MVTVRLSGEPVEYPNELTVSRGQISRLRASLPESRLTEIVRAPND